MDIDKSQVGNRIKEIRISKGKTLKDFGKLFDPEASDSIVSRWERGISLPNNKRLKKISELGNVSVSYLLNGVQDLLGNPLPVSDLAFYDFQILEKTVSSHVRNSKVKFGFFALKLTYQNKTKVCIVRSISHYNDESCLVEVYYENYSQLLEMNKFNDASLMRASRVDINDYIFARRSVKENFKEELLYAMKNFMLEIIDKNNKNHITFIFIDKWNKFKKV